MLLEESRQQIEEIVRRVVREEVDALRIGGTHPFRISLNFKEAGAATGYSHDTIRKAVQNHYLVASYANSKPVILVDELVRWLRTLPVDPRDI